MAEVLGAQHGIGLIISQAQGNFDMDTVFACMTIMAVFTLIAEFLITVLEKRVLADWKHARDCGYARRFQCAEPDAVLAARRH